MMEIFRDKYLYTKAYFEKPATPEEVPDTSKPASTPTPTPAEPENTGGEEAGDGRVLGHEALDGQIVGLYFSAGWCPPCQQFTALLGNVYDELRNRKANFEVVFISFDKNADEMERYYCTRHRDWYALPIDDGVKEDLKRKYNITAVPRLIVVTKYGEVISTKGRKEVQDKGVICYRNWQQTACVLDAKAAQAAEYQAEGNNGDAAADSGNTSKVKNGACDKT